MTISSRKLRGLDSYGSELRTVHNGTNDLMNLSVPDCIRARKARRYCRGEISFDRLEGASSSGRPCDGGGPQCSSKPAIVVTRRQQKQPTIEAFKSLETLVPYLLNIVMYVEEGYEMGVER